MPSPMPLLPSRRPAGDGNCHIWTRVLDDSLSIVIRNSPPWWVPILATALLAGLLQFIGVYWAYRLASKHSSELAKKQEAEARLARTEERTHAADLARWHARWQLLTGTGDSLEKLIRDIAHWTNHVQVLEQDVIIHDPTAVVTSITFMLAAVRPGDASKITSLLYSHYDHCVSCPPHERKPETALAIYSALNPLVERRKEVTIELLKMVTEKTEESVAPS